ncbi:DUF2807 domain-containing protein [Flavobacterium suaedae]|uniref:DUF2807 domain-containing protein n=1 Tax=Flavobacterium suaedae TaxID=1767027 RepID=A0ABQ1JWK0_9FLAO|nr:head GIN domain-containing protein [Flavobacterium suaedae]GGB77351.1 DUF2807 domain-containing protein [Flavobacterium suaedae]
MKKLIVIAFIVLSQAINAQVTKNIGDFTEVRVYDLINLTMIKSDENKLVITGHRADEVEVVNKNGKLKIRMQFTKLLQGEDIEAILYYTNTIDHIEASEGSFVGSADVFKATAFELNAKEGATIKIKLDVDRLKSKAASGGILELSGTTANHDVLLTSGAIMKAKGLETKQTEITINAGGEAEIFATDYVTAKTRAGGEIDIYGKPKQVDKKEVIAGDITIM